MADFEGRIVAFVKIGQAPAELPMGGTNGKRLDASKARQQLGAAAPAVPLNGATRATLFFLMICCSHH